MKNRYLLTILLFCCLHFNSWGQENSDSIVQVQPAPIPTIEIGQYSLNVSEGKLVFNAGGLNGNAAISINGEDKTLVFRNGIAEMPVESSASGALYLIKTGKHNHHLYHLSDLGNNQYRLRNIPMWLSLLPPLIAILLALIFKEVVVSLFVGVWTGAFIAGGLRIDSLYYLIVSFLAVVEKYMITALNDSGHLSVIIFSLMIGGMVAVISRNGGMAGVVNALSRYAKSRRSTKFVTWLLGVAIFFDDYANTLIVGNTMRSVTDKFKISREKLAYIVDSTAAPVAAIAFITTWIGAELGYIDDGIKLLHNFDTSLTPYAIFIESLKYSFYPFLTLIFILMLIYLKRDFGPMVKAEKRALYQGQVAPKSAENTRDEELENLDPVPGAPHKWHHAFIPVVLVILMTIFGLVDSGLSSLYESVQEAGGQLASQSWGSVWSAMGILLPEGEGGFFVKLGRVIGASDSYKALLWASLSGLLMAIAITLFNKTMKLGETINTVITGFKTMLPALIILALAWSLALTTEELNTATYLTSALADSINPYFVPAIIFVLAAFISFSTGSSWSTMAILYPIAVPTIWAICLGAGWTPEESMPMLYNVISTVLAASVLGDHCSPISDTTILSSLASDCNHIDHVRTQLPYALTVGIVSLVAGSLATMLGGGWLVCFSLMIASIAALFLIIRYVGEKVEDLEEG
ncbi:MAG: sodium:proton antiporter [Saprospiraceae bacterium]|nr:MAG: sodium:proton antiporter [Saprospiraceae bacterium]